MKEQWDQRYKSDKYIYGLKPNEFLATKLQKLTAGKILLPGDGEGRNAVFAAQQLWEVTAFDYSESAREKALLLAKNNSVNINFFTSDISFFESSDLFDVIAIIYLHLPIETRNKFHKKLASFLKPGGKILLECFSKSQLVNNSGGPKDIDLLYSLNDIKDDFADYTIEMLEEAETFLDEGDLHQGKANVIRLIATKN